MRVLGVSGRSEQGTVLGGGAYSGGSGLTRSGCPSTWVFLWPLLLVYPMFHPPLSRSQYSVLIKVSLTLPYTLRHVAILRLPK